MANKHTEAILLTMQFLTHVRGFGKDAHGYIQTKQAYKAAVLTNAYRCLYSGYTYDDLLDIMAGQTGSYYNLEELVRQNNPSFTTQDPPKQDGDLIQLGQFYVHPLLQEARSAPSYTLDSTTMEMTRQPREPFFLEIKEHFRIQDVLIYYYMTHQKDPIPGSGALTQLTNIATAFPLDLVLYMIEASAEQILEDEGPGARSPAFLPDYLDRARQMLDKRRQILREGGLTHVIPRHTYRLLD